MVKVIQLINLKREKKMEKKYKRHIYIINKSFQFKYLFIIIGVMLVTVVSVSFTTFYIIWSNVIKEYFFIPEASKKLVNIFIKTSELLIIPIIILLVIFSLIGIFYSHKIAGPLFRVKRICDELAKGNLNQHVKFRKGDEFHDIAESLNKVINGLKSLVKENRQIIDRIFLITQKLKNDLNTQKDLKSDVKDAIIELDKIVNDLKKSSEKFII